MISIDDENYDTDHGGQFTVLQRVLIRGSSSNKLLTERIEEGFKKMETKDKKIKELESKMISTSSQADKRIKSLEIAVNKMGNTLQKIGSNQGGEGSPPDNHGEEKDNKKNNTINNKSKGPDTIKGEEKNNEQQEKEIPVAVKQNNDQGKDIVKVPEIILTINKDNQGRKEIGNVNPDKNINNIADTETNTNQIVIVDIKTDPNHQEQILSNPNQVNHEGQPQISIDQQNIQSPPEIHKYQQQSESNNPSHHNNPPINHERLPRENESNEKLKTLFLQLSRANDRINDLQDNLIANQKDLKQTINNNQEGITRSNEVIANGLKQINDLNEKIVEKDKTGEEIKLKVNDFNIYELFKDNGSGNMDSYKLLILNLETKVFKKFSMLDDKNKTLEYDTIKTRNDVIANKSLIDGLTRGGGKANETINGITQENEGGTKKVQKIENKVKDYTQNINDINNATKDQIAQCANEVKDLENKLITALKQVNDEATLRNSVANDKGKSGNLISNEEGNQIKEGNKKYGELEKQMKVNFGLINIDNVNKRLDNVDKELGGKLSKLDGEEIYDKLRKSEKDIKDIDFKNKNNSEAIAKMKSDLIYLTQKMESFTIQQNNKNMNSNDHGAFRQSPIDYSKFIDQARFSENNKILVKQIDHVRLETEDLRRGIDDIVNQLKHTPNENHFKEFQDMVMVLIEENKLMNNKKYCDKIESNKNFRFLESQIKQITEAYNRRDDSGESWGIAKKPISGYQCASCDSNLQELKDKYEYGPWNKYPIREEKSHRMGHGFSRMLQGVNMDILKNAEKSRQQSGYSQEIQVKDNDTDYEDRYNGISEGNLKLPEVTERTKRDIGYSLDSSRHVISASEDIKTIGQNIPNQPKIVKIMKKRNPNKIIRQKLIDKGIEGVQEQFSQTNDNQEQ